MPVGTIRRRVRLIGKTNATGLSRDFTLLAAALQAGGCEVVIHGCDKPDRKRRRSPLVRTLARWRRRVPRYDANIMLEHVWPQFLHEAAANIAVPNPEWFDRHDAGLLSRVDCIWAKTAQAMQVFGARAAACTFIGFDSEDRHRAGVARTRSFFHLAGHSALKGTERLLALWQHHPEWPLLTVVQKAPRPLEARNITMRGGFVADAELATLQNSHRFHLCLSEAEGWGHYIAEALSCGAVTLATDAAPMNELVRPERGLLVAADPGRALNLVTTARFDTAALEQAIARALSLDDAQCDALGAAARAWFLDNKRGFTARVAAAVAQIGVTA